MGYDLCWASDHIAWPDPAEIESRYPYAEDGALRGADGHALDRRVVGVDVRGGVHGADPAGDDGAGAGLPAAGTDGEAVGVVGCVVGGGRAILGVGVGWMLEEFAALGMPSDHRGARADEMLEIYGTLFREARPSHSGRFYAFREVGFEPKPVRGRIPIWVGGNSAAAHRRTARYGDVFYPVFSPPAAVGEQWAAVRAACEREGRDPAEVSLSLRMRLRLGRESEDEGSLRGGADAVVEQIGGYAAVGVSHMTLDIARGGGVEGKIEAMEEFTGDVRAQLA